MFLGCDSEDMEHGFKEFMASYKFIRSFIEEYTPEEIDKWGGNNFVVDPSVGGYNIQQAFKVALKKMKEKELEEEAEEAKLSEKE